MRVLLQLKTWLLFLVFIIPLLLNTEALAALVLATWLLWIYAIAHYGQAFIVTLGLRPMDLKLFRVNFFVVGLSLAAQVTLKLLRLEMPDPEMDWLFVLLVAFSLYSGFAIYHVLYVAGLTVTQMELGQQRPALSYTIGHLLRVAVFPLGVWGVQPIVRRAAAMP